MAIQAAAVAKAAAKIIFSKDKKKATARLLIVGIAGAAIPSLFAVATVKEVEKKIVQKIEQKVLNKLFDKFQEKLDTFKEKMKARNADIKDTEKAKLDGQDWTDTASNGQSEAESANSEAESGDLGKYPDGIPPDELDVAKAELVDAADTVDGVDITDPTAEDPSELKWDDRNADEGSGKGLGNGDIREPEPDTSVGNHPSEVPNPADGAEADAVKADCSSSCTFDPNQDSYFPDGGSDSALTAEEISLGDCCSIKISDPTTFAGGPSSNGTAILDDLAGGHGLDAIPIEDVPSEVPPEITIDPVAAPDAVPASAVRLLPDGGILRVTTRAHGASISLTTRHGYKISMSAGAPADTSTSSTTSGTILPCDDQCQTLMAMEESVMLVTSDFDQTKHGPDNQEGVGQMLPVRRSAQMGCFNHPGGKETSGGPDTAGTTFSNDVSTLGCELIDDLAATRVPGQPPDMRAAFAKYVKDNKLPPVNAAWPGQTMPDRLCTPKLDAAAAQQAAGTTTATTTATTSTGRSASSTTTQKLPPQPVCTDPVKDCYGPQADQKCPSVLADFALPESAIAADTSSSSGTSSAADLGGFTVATLSGQDPTTAINNSTDCKARPVCMPTATLMTQAFHTFYQWNTDPSTVYHTNPLDDGSDIGRVAVVDRPDAPNVAAQTIAAAAYNAGFREQELLEAVALSGAATGYKKDFQGNRPDGKTGYGAWALSAEDAAKAKVKTSDLKDPAKAAAALYTLREPNNGWGFICAASNDGACDTKNPKDPGPPPFLKFETGPDNARSATEALADIVVAPPCTGSGSGTSSSGPSGGGTANAGDLAAAKIAAKAAADAGFRGELLTTMVAIARPESDWGRDNPPTNFNGSCCYGMWQINWNANKSSFPQFSFNDLSDPEKTAQMAMIIYRSQGLTACSWQVYGGNCRGGTYPDLWSQYKGIAQQAVDSLGTLPDVPCMLSTVSSSGPGACGNGGGHGGASSDSSGGVACADASTGGYVNPIKPEWYTPMRIDMGTDWFPKMADTPVIAIGAGKVVYAQSSGTGWPRHEESPVFDNAGGCIVYQLTSGSLSGKYIYVCEDVDPKVPVGATVTAGQTIAVSHYDSPSSCCWTEWGWASGPGPSPLTPYGGRANGYCTEGGTAFARFIHSLGGPWAIPQAGTCPFSKVPPGPNYP
jgi:hypothetical protein